MLFRHLLSILLLPCLAAVVVPALLLRGPVRPLLPAGGAFGAGLRLGGGAAALLAGVTLFGWCVALFARVGRGTLAPWDPTRRLVAAGPYRHVRNPMISGVAFVLIGETLLWNSRALALWAGAFLVVNHVYFVLSEEPGLERRFGAEYRSYAANVPRWLPRWRSWTSG